jgi:hypothetical protein
MDDVQVKWPKTARSRYAKSLWLSAFRCVRAGGAFGVLYMYGVGSTTAAAKERLCMPSTLRSGQLVPSKALKAPSFLSSPPPPFSPLPPFQICQAEFRNFIETSETA